MYSLQLQPTPPPITAQPHWLHLAFNSTLAHRCGCHRVSTYPLDERLVGQKWVGVHAPGSLHASLLPPASHLELRLRLAVRPLARLARHAAEGRTRRLVHLRRQNEEISSVSSMCNRRHATTPLSAHKRGVVSPYPLTLHFPHLKHQTMSGVVWSLVLSVGYVAAMYIYLSLSAMCVCVCLGCVPRARRCRGWPRPAG